MQRCSCKIASAGEMNHRRPLTTNRRRGERPNCNIQTCKQSTTRLAQTQPGGKGKEQVSSTNDAAASSRGRRYPKDCISRERERKTRKITIIQLPHMPLILCLYPTLKSFTNTLFPPHTWYVLHISEMHRCTGYIAIDHTLQPKPIKFVPGLCSRSLKQSTKELDKHGCLNDRRNLLQIVYFLYPISSKNKLDQNIARIVYCYC